MNKSHVSLKLWDGTVQVMHDKADKHILLQKPLKTFILCDLIPSNVSLINPTPKMLNIGPKEGKPQYSMQKKI